MDTVTAADRDQLLDRLVDASLDVVDAASGTAAAVLPLVERHAAADPEGCAAALAALRALLAATVPVSAVIDQVDG